MFLYNLISVLEPLIKFGLIDNKPTLEYGINVTLWRNATYGTLGKNDKRSPLNKCSPSLNLNFLYIAKVKQVKKNKKNPKIQKSINVAHFNKNVAPGEKLKN